MLRTTRANSPRDFSLGLGASEVQLAQLDILHYRASQYLIYYAINQRRWPETHHGPYSWILQYYVRVAGQYRASLMPLGGDTAFKKSLGDIISGIPVICRFYDHTRILQRNQ